MALTFTISIKPGLVGKVGLSHQLGAWPNKAMTPRELAQWAYFHHTGYCHGVFDNDAFKRDPLNYKTARANEFFQFAEVVTIDIDSKDFDEEPYQEHKDEYLAKAQFAALLENPFVRRHCFLIVPSSGNRLPDRPNWHLSFKLSKPITNPDEYRAAALSVAAQLDVPTDHQTCKAAQLTAGTLFKNPERHQQGYFWEDLYVNDDAEPVDSEALDRIAPLAKRLDSAIAWARQRHQRAQNYQETETGNTRVERHLEQTPEDRERVVLECLSYILPTFSDATDYDEWVQVWMSARHGSSSDAVRDYILEHPSVYWSDGEDGKTDFISKWENHVPKIDGPRYTVASLFYLASRAGWLSQTGYEIDEELAQTVEVAHVGDWLDAEPVVPKRLLLHSQTGSGKTETLIKLWERLEHPRTVVFVPTVKLAIELDGKLRRAGLETTLYVETATMRRKSRERLLEADVLVTTLQTFATKAHRGEALMHEYGLVYVEESDQLISQFARGGGSSLYESSHVTDSQARVGFLVLQDALQHSAHVWLVDATMTQASYRLAEALSSEPVRYVRNLYVRPKAAVNMLSDLADGYKLIYDHLEQGDKVVVACDKRQRAEEVVESMRQLGALTGRKALVLTKVTESHKDVQQFMEDVERGAKRYDLLVYNSVMASGVSIKETTPDVFVQFCEYLTPRANLQLLNRYRSQKRVYCYYSEAEDFYRRRAEDIYNRAGSRVDLESRTVSVEVVERNDLTLLRGQIATLSAADDELQRRAQRDFYRALLHADGRKVRDAASDPVDDKLIHTVEGVRRARREQRQAIRRGWREVAPITPERPALPEQTDLEVAKGRLHGEIDSLLGGNIPESATVEPEDADLTADEWIAEVCLYFKPRAFFLGALAHQAWAVGRAEHYLTDPGRSITSIAVHASMLLAFFDLRLLFKSLDDALTDGKYPEAVLDQKGLVSLRQRASEFIRAVMQHQPYYDTLFDRGRQRFQAILDKHPLDSKDRETREYAEIGASIDFARALLSKAGLRLKIETLDKTGGRRNRKLCIENLKEAEAFLRWKYPSDSSDLRVAWSGAEFESELRRNSAIARKLRRATPVEQARRRRMAREDKGRSRYRDIAIASQQGEIL